RAAAARAAAARAADGGASRAARWRGWAAAPGCRSWRRQSAGGAASPSTPRRRAAAGGGRAGRPARRRSPRKGRSCRRPPAAQPHLGAPQVTRELAQPVALRREDEVVRARATQRGGDLLALLGGGLAEALPHSPAARVDVELAPGLRV